MTKFDILMIVVVHLMNTKYQPYLEMTGAFSMLLGLGQLGVDLSTIYRTTKDVDVNYYGSIKDIDLNDLKEEVKRAYQKEGLPITNINTTYRPTTGSITVSYYVGGNKYKIDLAETKGSSYGYSRNISDILADKIVLANNITDRRFKDKVDVYIMITRLFPNGIEKGMVKQLIQRSTIPFVRTKKWSSRSTIEDNITQAGKFKPNKVTEEMTTIGVVVWIQRFLTGLHNPNIGDQFVYKGGDWIIC